MKRPWFYIEFEKIKNTYLCEYNTKHLRTKNFDIFKSNLFMRVCMFFRRINIV